MLLNVQRVQLLTFFLEISAQIVEQRKMQSEIFLDHSTLSTFRSCPEKARLSYVCGLRSKVGIPALDFGSAIHAGVAAWNIEIDNPERIKLAQAAFLEECRKREASLPLGLESDEKRSIERGLYLLEAYDQRWKNEPYETLKWQDGSGKPYVEIKFRVYLFTWGSRPVFYCGIIDRIMKSRTNGRAYINETKTTSQGLGLYVKQIRPNHQITGYDHACKELLNLDVAGTIWDCIFVSSRKGNDKGDIWKLRGIDLENDFARVETTRSAVDTEEWLFDITETAKDYLNWGSFGTKRFPRNTGNCHNYGGCQFRDVCSSNLNQTLIDSNFKVEKWEPWLD
jgi:hypothetical protein